MPEIKNVKISELIKQYLKEHPDAKGVYINPEKEYIDLENYLKLRQ